MHLTFRQPYHQYRKTEAVNKDADDRSPSDGDSHGNDKQCFRLGRQELCRSFFDPDVTFLLVSRKKTPCIKLHKNKTQKTKTAKYQVISC